MSTFIPFQYEVESLGKKTFSQFKRRILQDSVFGRNGMVIEGSERDGDLGGSGEGSLIECFWITDMYIKYFGPMPNGIFSCALSYQFYR